MSEPIYGNTPPFLGAKNGTVEKTDDADVLVYGVPWEGAVTWGDYTGCELGPKVMRLASGRYSGYLPELDHIDVFEHLQLADLGDVDVVPADVGETMRRIQAFAKGVWESGKFPLALGGDHGITYPIVAGLAEQYLIKKLAFSIWMLIMTTCPITRVKSMPDQRPLRDCMSMKVFVMRACFTLVFMDHVTSQKQGNTPKKRVQRR